MVIYPEQFPCASWQFTNSSTSFAARTAFDSGWTRQRRVFFTDTNQSVSLSFKMDTNMLEKFVTFWEANGADWLYIDLDGQEQVRMVAPMQFRYDNFDTVYVTVPAEKLV